MKKVFSNLFGNRFVREVDDIVAPLNNIIQSLEVNAEAAMEAATEQEAAAGRAVADAEAYVSVKKQEELVARTNVGKLRMACLPLNLPASLDLADSEGGHYD